MSDFYKKVATPETQGFKSAPYQGRDRDLNSEHEARTASGGFAGAVQELLGATATVVQTVKNTNERDKQERYKKHKLEIDSMTANSADEILRNTEQLIDADGKDLSELSYEERESYRTQATNDYMNQDHFLKKDFNDLIQQRITEKAFAVDDFLSKKSDQLYNEKNVKMLTDNAESIFLNRNMDIDVKLAEFNELLDNNIGSDKNINMTRKEALDQIMLPMYQSVIATGDPELVELLENDKVKEYFKNADGYDNIMQMAKKKAISIVAAKREETTEKLESTVYNQLELGGYLSKEDVDKAIAYELKDVKDGYLPTSKDMYKLKQLAYKGVEESNNVKDFLVAKANGDHSYLERSDMKPKEKEKIHLGAFKVLTGIEGETPQDIYQTMQSPQQKAALQSYLKEGGTFPKPFKDLSKAKIAAYTTTDANGNEKKVSYVDAMRINVNTYNELSSMSATTPEHISSVYAAEDLAKTMFYKNLIESIDSGSIDGGDAQQLVTNFTTDLEKRVDSTGRFRSVEIDEIMSQGEVREWAGDLSGSLPDWTTDPFGQNTFDYASKTLVANTSMFVAAGMSIDEAKDMSERKFKNEHLIFESSDGTETAIGGEFAKHFRGKEKAFDIVASELPQLKEIKESFTYLGNDYDFKRRLSVRPTPDFRKTGQVEVWFDDGIVFNSARRIENTRMDFNTFNDNWNKVKTKEKKEVESKYIRQLEERDEKEKRLSKYKNRNTMTTQQQPEE